MPQTYTFASWNVNGLRAVLKKDPSFIQIAQELDVDILALQETKLQEGQVDIDLPGYHQTWSYAERKGYSGTAVFSRQEPLRVLRADALLPYAGEGEAAELVPGCPAHRYPGGYSWHPTPHRYFSVIPDTPGGRS